MQEVAAIIGITTALAIGAASPGPSFIMVARTAASTTRTNGLYAALGMGVGGLLFAAAALLGLNGLLRVVPSLYWALKLLGGMYLAYIGIRIFLGAKGPLDTYGLDQASTKAATRFFSLGMMTQLSNPKTAIVYASVFAAFLPSNTSLAFDSMVAALVFMVEAGWYSIVAVILSSAGPRTAYLRSKIWTDRAAGGVMGVLGLKLALSAER
jgi:threonine/homoserine/homoserine lactone efflux protein